VKRQRFGDVRDDMVRIVRTAVIDIERNTMTREIVIAKVVEKPPAG